MATNNSTNTPSFVNKGDLLLGRGSGLDPSILPSGTNGQVLTVDSAETTGAKWATVSGGGTSISPYIVGLTGSDFTTIQAAIDQAVSDGASKTNQKNIYVKPGTYNEDISLSDGINVLGFDPYPSEDCPGIQFPNNGFLSAVLTGTVTHSSGDSKIYNIHIKPATDGNALNLNAIGGLLFIRGCRFDLSGSSSTLLSFSNADTIVISDCISASAMGKFLSSSSTDYFSIAIFSSEILSTTTSVIPTNGSANIQLSNSYLFGSIDASNASLFYFQAYASQHIHTSTDPLIQTGASTNGFITYFGCQFSAPGENAFAVASDNLVRLINSWNISGGNGVSGGGIASKNFLTGPSGQSIVVKNINTGFNGSEYILTQGGLQTSDNTTQTLASIPLNTNESITIMGDVVGAQSDHSNAVGGSFTGTARRASGNIALVGTPSINVHSSSTATFSVDVDTASQSIRLRATGVSATTYNWVATVQYQKILTNA